MIYLTKFILIYFSFYLSFFINKKFKNFDQPGLNKTHKKGFKFWRDRSNVNFDSWNTIFYVLWSI